MTLKKSMLVLGLLLISPMIHAQNSSSGKQDQTYVYPFLKNLSGQRGSPASYACLDTLLLIASENAARDSRFPEYRELFGLMGKNSLTFLRADPSAQANPVKEYCKLEVGKLYCWRVEKRRLSKKDPPTYAVRVTPQNRLFFYDETGNGGIELNREVATLDGEKAELIQSSSYSGAEAQKIIDAQISAMLRSLPMNLKKLIFPDFKDGKSAGKANHPSLSQADTQKSQIESGFDIRRCEAFAKSHPDSHDASCEQFSFYGGKCHSSGSPSSDQVPSGARGVP